MPILFSIIVPVYNTEKYLPQCIHSVLTQTYQNFELLLVDDGSADSSGNICDEYAAQDARVRVFHQVNQGHTMARRKGISEATGEYVLFLDSDDYWDSNLLETIHDTANRDHCDMILFRFRRVTDSGRVIAEKEAEFPNGTLFTKENRKPFYLALIDEAFNSLSLKAVRRNIIDNEDYSRYRHIKNGEDLLQTLPLVNAAESIVYLDRVLYNYRDNPSSITNNFNLQLLLDILEVRGVLREYLDRWNATEQAMLNLYYAKSLKCIVSCGYRLSNRSRSSKGKKEELSRLYSLPMYHEALQHYDRSCFPLSQRIAVALFKRHCSWLFKPLFIAGRVMKYIQAKVHHL